eukprot:TRINITY_DN2728_c0_g1_i2.p4 TRINITY_DN2728_c0_g1~~TRINITY_DN2728_c0_g1_i2.p4  ORF type:complete len:104 (-),score=1.34 TRINITY_DN2728_c0_g1_i2:656-967(-)
MHNAWRWVLHVWPVAQQQYFAAWLLYQMHTMCLHTPRPFSKGRCRFRPPAVAEFDMGRSVYSVGGGHDHQFAIVPIDHPQKERRLPEAEVADALVVSICIRPE